ncbi:MAG: type III-A CRISPR-associated protein Csm2 [Lachnospirales bacterium]
MKQLDDLTYVAQAEEVVKKLYKDDKGYIKPSTNKIRNMLTLINELYNKARYIKGDKIGDELKSHIQYVKMRLVYEGGRDNDVKYLLEKSDMLKYLDSIGDSKKDLIRLCHYMEALVAYHKYYTKE